MNKKIVYTLLTFFSINVIYGKSVDTTKSKQSPKESISITYKKLTKKECKKYLGNNKFNKNGFQPVQVSITNTTNHAFDFTTQHLNIPTISTEAVLKTMSAYLKDHALKLTIIGAFLFWPALIAGVVKLVRIDSSTQFIEYNLDKTTLKNQSIAANSMISGIIFINPKSNIKNHTIIL